jgi:flagellar biosynthesis GTPase FlhF
MSDEAGNVYDKIFKENAERIFLPLVERHLGARIVAFSPWKEKLQTTLEREMDFFYRVRTDREEEFLLHLEFQLGEEAGMIYRKSEYHGIALRRMRMAIRHIVIYLGRARPRMPTRLPEEQVFRGFELVSLHHDFQAEDLLAEQAPEAILLAILAYYEEDRGEVILRVLLRRLRELSRDKSELSKYLSQLTMLSRLRNLQELTEKVIRDMPIEYDISTDYFYLKGVKQGIEQGIEQERRRREEIERMLEELRREVEEERRLMEAIEHQAEEERQRAEEERRQAEAIKRRLEEERRRMEAEKRLTALKMLRAGIHIDLIADFLNLPIEEIEMLGNE